MHQFTLLTKIYLTFKLMYFSRLLIFAQQYDLNL